MEETWIFRIDLLLSTLSHFSSQRQEGYITVACFVPRSGRKKVGKSVFSPTKMTGFLPVSTSVLTNNICGVSTSNSVTEATLHQKTLQITFHGGLYHPGFGDKVRIREPEKFPKFYAAFGKQA